MYLNFQNHEIPVANIPCLNQKLNNETQSENNAASTSSLTSTSNSNICTIFYNIFIV